jgi:hypothetical protein
MKKKKKKKKKKNQILHAEAQAAHFFAPMPAAIIAVTALNSTFSIASGMLAMTLTCRSYSVMSMMQPEPG